jgi:hypothetical protein
VKSVERSTSSSSRQHGMVAGRLPSTTALLMSRTSHSERVASHVMRERASSQPPRERHSTLVAGHRRLVLARSRPASRGEILAQRLVVGSQRGRAGMCRRAAPILPFVVHEPAQNEGLDASASSACVLSPRGLAMRASAEPSPGVESRKLTVPALRRGLFGLEE